jgi:hypothetical protein
VRRFVVCWRGDDTLSAAARLLLEHLRAQARGSVQQRAQARR